MIHSERSPGAPVASLLFMAVVVTVTLLTAVSAQDATPEPTPYERIVTAATGTDEGGVTVYELEGEYFAEIPAAALERDLLWYAEIGAAPPGASLLFGVIPLGTSLSGDDGRMVRLERDGDRLLVLDLTASATRRTAADEPPGGARAQTEPDTEKVRPIDVGVGEFSQPSIILALPVVAESPDGDLVIDVGAVFGGDVPQFSAAALLQAAGSQVVGVDPERSFVTRASSYPDNLFVTNLLTFVTADGDAVSIETKHTLLLLPEDPMEPRVFDPRVGYFNLEFTEFGDRGAEARNYILRHRLDKADPDAEIGEPVEPIVYYLGPGVPDVWRPYLREGIESWNVAFEGAGFRNAVQVRDAPSPSEDPDWDPGNARVSVIRWLAEPAANAMGPSLYDPRSGEIISNHILVWSDVLDLAVSWYYGMAGATDPRAATLPLPEEVIGTMMGYIVAHEVGHALGLRHNQRASTAYTVEQLRDPDFACANGSTASIMAYGRLNYVAQPEDGVPPACLLPRVGPYDAHAIVWGYTPDLDGAALEALAARVEEDPWLLWVGDEEQDGVDPYVLTQNVGRGRVEATRLGLDNLDRIAARLVDEATREGGPDDLAHLWQAYQALLSQWRSIVGSVPRVIGGVVHAPTFDPGRPQYRFVGAAEQREAVAFLNERVFGDPGPLLDPELLARLGGANASDALGLQRTLLILQLLDPVRFERLREQQLRQPDDAYAPEALLADLQAGLFTELRAAPVAIGPLRRDLQRGYVTTLATLADPLDADPDAAGAALTAYGLGPRAIAQGPALGALTQLKVQLRAALPNAADEGVANHLRQLERLVDTALTP